MAARPVRCEGCGAKLRWNVGPQYSGWIAPDLDGHLLHVCFRDADAVWQGHRPDARSLAPEAILARTDQLEALVRDVRAELLKIVGEEVQARRHADQELSWIGFDD